MDFVGGALPNVMFIAGIIAVGIGLGLEFKIVEIKGELSRRSRYGAFGVGALLIATSIFIYTRPAAPTATNPPTPLAASLTPASTLVTTDTPPPSSTPAPAAATPQPDASTLMPSPIQIVRMVVPDLQGLSTKDAERVLKASGLQLGKGQSSCDQIGAPNPQVKIDKGKIACQSVPKGSLVPQGSVLDYAMSSPSK